MSGAGQDNAANKLLGAMVERLLSAMANGPAMNCRPHSSRQRIDLTHLSRLGDLAPPVALRELLGPAAKVRIRAAVEPAPAELLSRVRRCSGWRGWGERASEAEAGAEAELTPEERARVQAWDQQHSVLNKLRAIAEDARAYEQDTGVPALALGFPLLSLPPGGAIGGARGVNRRIIAPVAFLPLHLMVRSGPQATVELACRGEGAELVTANDTLLVWLAQQAGSPEPAELFEDEHARDPWRELRELVAHVAKLVGAAVPPLFAAEEAPREIELQPAPTAEQADAWSRPTLVPAAVLGLYPTANQGLLRDAQAMAAGEDLQGPVRSFVHLGERLADEPAAEQAEIGEASRDFETERPVAACDPCQMRAVRLARVSRGLVVHGPPGTGKSQTITNVIADHLARGERVLFVCDKRTALDVVYNRLEHLGLGNLCALIHDPKRDWRTLYTSLRDRLDRLAEATPSDKAARRLAKVDAELAAIHAELSRVHAALHGTGGGEAPSFHDLVGRWLAEDVSDDGAVEVDVSGVPLAQYEDHRHEVEATLRRAQRIDYWANPWRKAAGVTLEQWAQQQVEPARQAMRELDRRAQEVDGTRDAKLPPFAAEPSYIEQAQDRAEMADRLEALEISAGPAILAAWAGRGDDELAPAAKQVASARSWVDRFQTFPLDPELLAVVNEKKPAMADLRRQSAALQAYLAVADRWHAFLHFMRRRQASAVLGGYGLPLTPRDAKHLDVFLEGLLARLALVSPISRLSGDEARAGEAIAMAAGPAPVDDRSMERTLRALEAVLAFRQWFTSRPALRSLAAPLAEAMAGDAKRRELVEGLRASGGRGKALAALARALSAAAFIASAARERLEASARAGGAVHEKVSSLAGAFDTLEDVLRVDHALHGTPAALQPAMAALLRSAVDERTPRMLLKRILAAEVSRRLMRQAELRDTDARRLTELLERYRSLGEEKTQLVRDLITCTWIGRQRRRLLAATGTRLGPAGAALRRRLVTRGKNVVRLRQLVGSGEAGGAVWEEHPLLELCPVWMASPQTVAQIFPREAMFDVVIFDEASQVRLEESLPVLTRARRLVVAGDPKQLPPTRFFETALASSEEEEAETDQELYEQQQSQTEDLLAAALGLDIQQCFLDVHYRSRNADLIGFSNEQFYNSRLQAIPGHPRNRTIYAPVRLYAVDGIYQDRQNQKEAEQVVAIVRDLLKWAEPPSIGIACFNLPQRDLILEKLDEAAAADSAFARQLAAARERRGEASFEGLFVKNLENVQGDERDHIIISTTYGLSPEGKFRRNFGPVSQAGGGRRLNVLVTRARREIHLVTSFPPAEFRSLPQIPEGHQATGRWLLYAYLQYAERLQALYNQTPIDEMAEARGSNGDVTVLETRAPSRLAEALAARLAASAGIGSDVYWGNEGLGIDLVLKGDDQEAGGVTVAVLCDLTRFAGTDDPVEWEAFRTLVHEQQGWPLVRAWAPHIFRDPAGAIGAVAAQHAAVGRGLSGGAESV